MRIFVTDVGNYWNHENPILERYAECVVVVCLNGKKVTDKYECVVSPYEPAEMDEEGELSLKFKALKSVEQKLRRTYSYHGELVFLTDNEPESLYPYLVLKDNERNNNMHLWCMSPYKMEAVRRKNVYFEMLQDLSKLKSILYVDSDMLLQKMDKNAKFSDLHKKCEELFSRLLPQVLYEIDNKLNHNYCYYFDFAVNRYIETDDAFDKILALEPLSMQEVEDYQPYLSFCTLGIVIPYDTPDHRDKTKMQVCRLVPRFDGKQVCEMLKKMRKELAEANGISYEVMECPSTGPCAGTCPQCDKELRALQEALMEKAQMERVYPQFNVLEDFYEVPLKLHDLAHQERKGTETRERLNLPKEMENNE